MIKRLLTALALMAFVAWPAAAQTVCCGPPAATPIGSGNSTSIAANSTNFLGVAGNNNATSVTTIVTVPVQVTGVLQNLMAAVTTAPGVGQTVTVTLYAGAYGSLVATGITCQISGTNTSCTDTTHTANITAGQGISWQFVTSASATATGGESYGIGVGSPH